MFQQTVIWILLIGVWWAISYYSWQITQMIGRSSWADQYLWWTKNAVVLFWFLVIILWVLFMCGVFKWSSPMDISNTF